MVTTHDIDERINKCTKILDADPNSQIFAALAEALRKKGELDKAFRVCQNGLKIHPSYGPAHVVMAKINLDRGMYDWAMAEANKAAELDGRTRTVELLMAEIFIYKGEFNNAIKLLKKLSASDPDNAQIKKLLEIAERIPEEQTVLMKKTKSAATATPAESSASPVPVQEPQPVQEWYGTKDILDLSIKIPGIDGILLINKEGLVLESEWTVKLDPTVCGATLGEVGNLMDKELLENSFGKFSTVMIEVPQYTYYLKRVHDGVFLFVANQNANLGTIRMKVDNLLVSYR